VSEEAQRTFRLDNEVLAFRFTATLSHRNSPAPLERLSGPARLRLWLAAAGLDPSRTPATADVSAAIILREAIYRLGAAIAHGALPPTRDVDTVNAAAAAGHPIPVLTHAELRWQLDSTDKITDALAVIARDAIITLTSHGEGQVKTCDNPDCAGLFLDASRGANRRWCSMNTCGNKAKKTRMAQR
jgi:predicted RNA-binding Zn ribbon-like protein